MLLTPTASAVASASRSANPARNASLLAVCASSDSATVSSLTTSRTVACDAAAWPSMSSTSSPGRPVSSRYADVPVARSRRRVTSSLPSRVLATQ